MGPADPLVGGLDWSALIRGSEAISRSRRGEPGARMLFNYRGGADRGGGGDEETRTPDPLLAKEMLYRLSYVPTPERRWWAFLDSNQRPLPYQGSALTS
jgi:hypothetical protein